MIPDPRILTFRRRGARNPRLYYYRSRPNGTRSAYEKLGYVSWKCLNALLEVRLFSDAALQVEEFSNQRQDAVGLGEVTRISNSAVPTACLLQNFRNR